MTKYEYTRRKSAAKRGALAFCTVATLSLGACTESRELGDVSVETSVQAASADSQDSASPAHKRGGLASLLAFLFRKHHGHGHHHHGGHHDDDDDNQCHEAPQPSPTCTFLDISTGMRTGPFRQIIFDSEVAGRVYGVEGGLLHLSDDGGRNFDVRDVQSPAGLSLSRIAPVHGSDTLYALTGKGLARTDDGGLNYELLGLRGLDIKALHVHPADPLHVYLSTYQGGLYRSTNGGRTFEAVSGGLPSSQNYAWDFSGDPLDSSVILAAMRDGARNATTEVVYRSDSMGGTWSPVPGTSYPTAFARCSSDPSTVIVGAEAKTGVLLSRDNGSTFTPMPLPVPSTRPFSGAVGGPDCQTIYVTAYQDKIYRSTDGGASFVPAAAAGIDLTWPAPRELLVDPYNAQVVVARFDGGTYRSEDGGETFQPFGGRSTPRMNDVHVTSDGSEHIWVSTWGGGVFHKDGPAAPFQHVSASTLPTDFTYTAQRVSSDSSVLVGGFPTLYASQDDGQSFTAGGNCNVRDFLVDPRDAQVIYASSYACGVQRSDDGGQTWLDNSAGLSRANLPANQYGATMMVKDPRDPDRLFVGHDWVGVFVRGGDDAPFTHSLQTAQNRVSALEADGQDVYAAVAGLGVAVTRDSGASWSFINDGLPTRDIGDLEWDAASSTLYAASSQGLFRLVEGRWVAFESECIPTAGRIALSSGSHGSSLVILQSQRILQQPLD